MRQRVKTRWRKPFGTRSPIACSIDRPDGRCMARRVEEAQPESDRFEDAVHPRETFALVGHAEAERDFLTAYRADRLPQAILIAGPHGIGKATLAWRLSRFLLAHPDPASA